jgi:FlaA1/EpsC-like NDP-sugar epimerase
LVTGGAGFIGKYLVRELLNKYQDIKVKVIVRSENQLVNLLVFCANDKRIVPIMGDIRNISTIEYSLQDVDTVMHLAAMKHIDLCELSPTEAIDINVIATMNLLNIFEGKVFISMSTDKVVGASGCYGATKLLLEKLTMEKAQKYSECKFMVVRSGNIFGSSGSVIPKWIKQIKQDNKVTVTDLGMTRFFINVESLVSFMANLIESGENGKIYIPDQVIINLGDLAKAVIDKYGDNNAKLEVIGLRKGEKMHEQLFNASENNVVTKVQVEPSNSEDMLHRIHPGMDIIKSWLEKVAE